MYPAVIQSPLGGGPAKLVETRPVAPIVQSYCEAYGYDPSDDFGGVNEIAVYECAATGYRFYFPYMLEGKAGLYSGLQHGDYYEDTKWEHETIIARIPEGASILDVGCGAGAFLAKAKAKTQDVTGLELTHASAERARQSGLAVLEIPIGQHGQQHDVVTAFQVLEHVADPLAFLNDCLAALKPGGMLAIAVPNNASFLRFCPDMPLNQPPHHMGLWTDESLAQLANLLPMELISIEREPLRQLDWYQQIMERRYLPKRWQRSLYYRLGGASIFKRFIAENAGSIAGHTVIACFRKDAP